MADNVSCVLTLSIYFAHVLLWIFPRRYMQTQIYEKIPQVSL